MFDKETLQKLYRYSYSLSCNEADAYDLLQDAIEKFIKTEVDTKNSTAYIKKVIYNSFVDDCRRKKIIDFDNIEENELPADFDIQTLETIQINENLAEQIMLSLEPDEREIIYYWAIEGFSTSEIAEYLGKPKGTILSKIYRMRHRLIEQFNDGSNEILEVI